MKRLYLVSMFVLLSLYQGYAQIKITEIMYNPSSAEDNWEYVELYNAGANPVDLSGYVLDDGNTWYLNAPNISSGIIPAKGTVVLFNDDDIDAADFQAAWGNQITLVAVSNWERLGLNNSGDDIALWSSFAAYAADTASMNITFTNAVSHVAFDDDGIIWPLDDGAGSIRLKDLNADISVGSNWALSVATDGVSMMSGNAGGNSGADVGSPGIQAANTFTLQLLHYADVDGNEEMALDAVDEFSGLVNGLKNDPTYGSQTLLVTSGDIIIPGPRFFAAESNKVRALTGCNEPGHIDIYFANKMGVHASTIGNHELDAGPGEFHDAAFSSESSNGIVFPGSEFAWLSSNIDFSNDVDFQNSIGTDGDLLSNLNSKVAKYAIKVINGDTIGLVGASVPSLPTITTTGDLVVYPTPNWTVQSLAVEIQKSVDALKNMGVNKIILISHMQQISVEKSLANLLNGVDIIVAGGSNTRMGDNTDALYSSAKISDAAFDETYPFLTNSINGDPVAVVNVDGDYKYLGRLVVEFDKEGKLIIGSLDPNISGVYASIPSNVSAVNGTIHPQVLEVRDSLLAVINAQ
ncbi:MAG: lamin tail domain-containing protein, partial [Bacteroidota bacterium]|nr:lamin tail domain-containing protein [Bacteroidota bacterium]MDX5429937.1 lamin tail domain-containing protein [Bacteroidota bacterium]MDX5468710.1 lamin tail domain-containing protein [Bacteroidota bacterium]